MINKDYLYILPFENGKYFKIGISSENYNRILTHHQSFKINLNQVTIVVGSKKNIRTMERILLSLYEEVTNNPYKGKDGASEVRHNNNLKQCLKDIEYWSERINLTINHPTKKEIVPKIRKEVKRLTNEEKKIRQQKQTVLKQEQNLFNIKGLKKEIQELFLENPPDNIESDGSLYGAVFSLYWVKENTPKRFLNFDFSKTGVEYLDISIHTIPPVSLLGFGNFNIGVRGIGSGKVNGYNLFCVEFYLKESCHLSTNEEEQHVSEIFLKEYALFEKWFEKLVSPHIEKNIMISIYERPIP